MKVNVYSVYDEKAAAYTPPFFMQKDAMAVRSFEDEVNNPQSRINAHADDFALYNIGSFDDESGMLIPNKAPVFIVKAASLKKLK